MTAPRRAALLGPQARGEIERRFANGPTGDGGRDPRRSDKEHERQHALGLEN